MPVKHYDCGSFSEVVISPNSASGIIRVLDDIGNNIGRMSVEPGMSPITFMCSDDLNLKAPSGLYNIFISHISLQNTLVENSLMGLAGVVCGCLISCAYLKYAV